jgi:cytochrome P450
MLTTDPPDHTRLRRLVAAAFTRPRVEALRPRVAAIADELADALDRELDRSGTADLVAAFTAPLPVRVIAALLGVPPGGEAEFRTWTERALGEPSPGQRAAFADLNGLLADLVAAKRRAPGDDLLSALVAVRDADDGRLSADELVGTAALLVVAGHDTTVNLLGNAVVALLHHPDQADLLARRPELVPGAVEEFLRYDPSVEHTPMRFAARDLTLGGVGIRRGEVVVVSLTSAGRSDPALAPQERDVLDVTRPAARHLAFGHGVHHCLGAPLARLEATVGLGTVVRRFPGLRAAVPLADIPWRPVGLMRGPRELPVRRGPAHPFRA